MNWESSDKKRVSDLRFQSYENLGSMRVGEDQGEYLSNEI